MTAVTTRYGLMEVIERDSIVSQALMMYGEWAQEELNLLGRFIQPGACVLDAGAFIGTHTLAFARMVGVAGKVYAFEPRREIFAYLQRNIALNGASQVRVCNVALGARLARLAMAPLDLLHEDNFGGLALALSSETADEARYDVEIVTLDGMDLSPVDLIKLDVEGMESEVLAGAQAVIARDRPVIFAECNSLGGGAPLLAFAALSEYRVFGYVCPAYDAANFNKCAENIFGPAKELGLVLLPAERVEMYQAVLTQTSLPEVENLDSLACLLLSKPQYFDEVLAPFCGTHDVKLALATPELAAANEARGRCEAALSEVKELAFARLDEITALKARIEATDAALSEASELALERLDEVTALKARIEPTDVALSEASQFALERLDKVTALKARIESTDAALSKASQLALERLDEIGAQKRQEGEMQAALADARLHAQDLEKRLEGAETELRVLEQNKIWRALRATGLMKAPK